MGTAYCSLHPAWKVDGGTSAMSCCWSLFFHVHRLDLLLLLLVVVIAARDDRRHMVGTCGLLVVEKARLLRMLNAEVTDAGARILGGPRSLTES